ncbi:hypothetical protein D3C87_1968020 [compost metagenome]
MSERAWSLVPGPPHLKGKLRLRSTPLPPVNSWVFLRQLWPCSAWWWPSGLSMGAM